MYAFYAGCDPVTSHRIDRPDQLLPLIVVDTMARIPGTNLVTKLFSQTKSNEWAVVVAQLVERLLLIPEVCGSNPVIGKNLFIYIEHLLTVNCVLERQK